MEEKADSLNQLITRLFVEQHRLHRVCLLLEDFSQGSYKKIITTKIFCTKKLWKESCVRIGHQKLAEIALKKSLPACWLRCPHLSNIQLCMLLFGTVMYGYHMDQNPEDGMYSLNFEAGHRTFVKQWEMSQFTIGKSVNFLKYFFFTTNKSKWVHISPYYAWYNPLLGLLKKIHLKKKDSEKFSFQIFSIIMLFHWNR